MLLCNALHRPSTVLHSCGVGRACSRYVARLVGSRRSRPFPDVTLREREVGEPVVRYIWLAQLVRLVTSTSSPPPPMMSWSFLPLSWPVRIHIIVLALALVPRGQLANANGCRHRPFFIVDSSDLDAGVTYSGGSWVTKQDDPSANVFFFGGSTMRTSSNGDSVEFVFQGPSVCPPRYPRPFGRSFQRLTRVTVGCLQETPLRSSEMSGGSMPSSPLRWTAKP